MTYKKKKYWDFVFSHNRRNPNGEAQENREANPDMFREESAMYHVSDEAKEVQARVQKLMMISKQILTEQQYKVFFFLTERTMTQRAVAKVLGISQKRVNDIWQTAREKLQRAYDERTA